MATKLISIIGIDNAIADTFKLKGISTIKDFYDATRTPSDRDRLSKITGFSAENIARWSVQAELMRVDGMSAQMAVELMDAGVYSVEQFQAFGEKGVAARINKTRRLSNQSEFKMEKLTALKHSKIRPAARFDTSGLLGFLNAVANAGTERKISDMYEDLSEVISELGKGIAKAQYELDMHALEVQNKILQDEALYAAGMNATWYVMPEAEFNLKMDYTVSQESQTNFSANPTGKKVRVMPMNATAQNYFKTEKAQESSLRIRFVPVPLSEKFTNRIIMPQCVGLSGMEALERLEENGVESYKFITSDGMEIPADKLDNRTVTAQSIVAGKVVLIGQTVELTV